MPVSVACLIKACITGFYEKVINVKADVAAVLVSVKQRFGERRWTLSRASRRTFISTLDSVHRHSDTRVGNEAEHVRGSASFLIGVGSLSRFRATELGFLHFCDDRSRVCIAATHVAGLLSAL